MSGVVAALFACAVLGLAIDRGLLGDPGRGTIERTGRALMLGLGAAGCLSLLVDAICLGVTRSSVGGAAVLLLLALARPALRVSARCVREQPLPAESDDRGILAARVGLLLLAAVGLGLAVHAGWSRPTFQFDALARWMFKAKALYVDGTLLGPVSTDEAFGFTHQRYPPLVSHIANLPQLIAGGPFDDRIGSAIFPWFAVAMVGVAYGALRRRCGALCAALGAAWIANLPLLSYVFAPPPGAGASSAMADIPLGLFILGALLAAADGVEQRRVRGHLEAGLLLAFAMLTKNEGTPFAAALCLGVLVAAPRARGRRALGILAVGLGVFFLLWGWIALGLPATDEHYAGRIHTGALQEGIGRLGIILPRMGRELINFRAWSLTWPAVLALLCLGWRSLRGPVPRLVLMALAVQLASYVMAYVVTVWSSPAAEFLYPGGDPLPFLMDLTLGRLIMQVAPAAIVLALIVSPLEARRSG